ncbi:MAG: DNA polymerase IV [Hyphomicrobiaceae bacterium]
MIEALCRDCAKLVPGERERCPDCGGSRLVHHAELFELSVGHVDCDAFYASVEKRDRPEIREQPLIVGHAGGRGVVTTACYIARTFGIRSAMPMFRAMELCPKAVVLPPDMAKYKSVSREIRAIFREATQIVEPLSLDEAYLDLSAARTGPPAVALARIARRVEQEVSITVSVGLAPNKFLAKLASDLDKPRGFSVIGRREAEDVLAPMPVGKIHGVGAVMAGKLAAAGFPTIGDLQARGEMEMVTRFGRFGRQLWHYARGEDDRRVTPDRPTKSISSETTFGRDLRALAPLLETARELSSDVAASLVRQRLAGLVVVVKLKTADFKLISRSRRLPHPTQREPVLMEAAAALIAREADGRAFRLLGIGVDVLTPATEADPPDLFDGLGEQGHRT